MSDHFLISLGTLSFVKKYPSPSARQSNSASDFVFSTSICNFADVTPMSALSCISASVPAKCSFQDPRTLSGIVQEVVRFRAEEKEETGTITKMKQ